MDLQLEYPDYNEISLCARGRGARADELIQGRNRRSYYHSEDRPCCITLLNLCQTCDERQMNDQPHAAELDKLITAYWIVVRSLAEASLRMCQAEQMPICFATSSTIGMTSTCC
jgi:hypothetical protein